MLILLCHPYRPCVLKSPKKYRSISIHTYIPESSSSITAKDERVALEVPAYHIPGQKQNKMQLSISVKN